MREGRAVVEDDFIYLKRIVFRILLTGRNLFGWGGVANGNFNICEKRIKFVEISETNFKKFHKV